MIVDDPPTPDIAGAEWSPESSIAEPYTPSQFEAPVAIERSPVACGSLNIDISHSFSLSHLYRHSAFDLQLEGHHSHAHNDFSISLQFSLEEITFCDLVE
jgi:hypothetical protein